MPADKRNFGDAASVSREFELVTEAAKTPDDPVTQLAQVRQSAAFHFYKHGFAAYFGCTPEELEDPWVVKLADTVLRKPSTTLLN